MLRTRSISHQPQRRGLPSTSTRLHHQIPSTQKRINNRTLRSFEVTLDTTLAMLADVPAVRLLVTESGILGRADVQRMRAADVQAFLVGEAFMRQPDPGVALADLFEMPADLFA